MKIPAFKDRDPDIEGMRTALGLANIPLDYIEADYLYQILQAYKNKGVLFNLEDATRIREAHYEKWK